MKKKNGLKENKKASFITAKEFDRKFEVGEDISEYVDWDSAIRRINLDIPEWAVKTIDEEAKRRGVARQALMKMWIIDKLDDLANFKREKQSA